MRIRTLSGVLEKEGLVIVDNGLGDELIMGCESLRRGST